MTQLSTPPLRPTQEISSQEDDITPTQLEPTQPVSESDLIMDDGPHAKPPVPFFDQESHTTSTTNTTTTPRSGPRSLASSIRPDKAHRYAAYLNSAPRAGRVPPPNPPRPNAADAHQDDSTQIDPHSTTGIFTQAAVDTSDGNTQVVESTQPAETQPSDGFTQALPEPSEERKRTKSQDQEALYEFIMQSRQQTSSTSAESGPPPPPPGQRRATPDDSMEVDFVPDSEPSRSRAPVTPSHATASDSTGDTSLPDSEVQDTSRDDQAQTDVDEDSDDDDDGNPGTPLAIAVKRGAASRTTKPMANPQPAAATAPAAPKVRVVNFRRVLS